MGNNDNFYRIVEMNTDAERRSIATAALQGLLSTHQFDKEYDLYCKSCYMIRDEKPKSKKDYMAMYAVSCADALIAELNKKKR